MICRSHGAKVQCVGGESHLCMHIIVVSEAYG